MKVRLNVYGKNKRRTKLREDHKEVTHLPVSGGKSTQQDVIHLAGQPKKQRPQQRPQERQNLKPNIRSEYQERLLNKIKETPGLMKLLGNVFKDYPEIIRREMRMNSEHATKRQKENGRQQTMRRLQLEADLERQLCILAGIDLNSLRTPQVQETTESDVFQAVIEEEVTPTDIKSEKKPVKKKTAKKKTSKKKTTRKKTAKKVVAGEATDE